MSSLVPMLTLTHIMHMHMRSHLDELFLRNETIAILVPIVEQIDDADGVLGERVAQQLRDRPAARSVELHRRRQRGPLSATSCPAEGVLLLDQQAGVLFELPIELPSQHKARGTQDVRWAAGAGRRPCISP